MGKEFDLTVGSKGYLSCGKPVFLGCIGSLFWALNTLLCKGNPSAVVKGIEDEYEPQPVFCLVNGGSEPESVDIHLEDIIAVLSQKKYERLKRDDEAGY